MSIRKSILLFALTSSAAFAGPEVVVSGAGPAGLATGIGALLAGARRVEIFEKRPREAWASRHRSVFLSEATIKTLTDYGVTIPATPIADWHIVRNGRRRILPNAGHWKHEIFAQIFHAKYDSIVRIGDLERALYDRLTELGGEVRFGRAM